jgi:hypothetical protein
MALPGPAWQDRAVYQARLLPVNRRPELSGPNRTVGERHAGAARGQGGSASVTPASPTTIRVVATGGMADWRITLIVGPERLGMCWRCFRPEPLICARMDTEPTREEEANNRR